MNGPSPRQVLTALLLAIVLSVAGAFALSAGQAPAASLALTPVALPIAAQLPTPTATPSPTPMPSPTTTPQPTPGNPALHATATPPPSPTPTPTAIPTPTPVPIGAPVRLKIPTIRVDAAVEHVALAPDGQMDTPQDYADVAWYSLGPKPGELGNAAISGHVDSKRGAAVFWDLRKLKPGDEVFVVGSDGIERRFLVTDMEFYKAPDVPLERIFGPAPGIHLNLFTCAGVFDRSRQAYDSRLVVYTELAP